MNLPPVIALVDHTAHIGFKKLSSVAGALSEQIMADFGPTWRVRASVVPMTTIPLHSAQWAVHVQSHLDEPGALGYHTNGEFNQPVSYVKYDADWTVTVSHEILEMLADPYGNRLHQARLPYRMDNEATYRQFGIKHPTSYVHYLLEVCDPCEATEYIVGGERLSDFLTPTWYRTNGPASGAASSHAGGCAFEREVAEGGYVSFCNNDGYWFQVFCRNGSLSVSELGKFDRSKFATLREFADVSARHWRNR